MKKLVIIHVTQKHIDDANKQRSEGKDYIPSRCCAVTRALCDVFGPNCSSSETFIGLPMGIVNTPDGVSSFINRFDFGGPVEPFSFTIAHE